MTEFIYVGTDYSFGGPIRSSDFQTRMSAGFGLDEAGDFVEIVDLAAADREPPKQTAAQRVSLARAKDAYRGRAWTVFFCKQEQGVGYRSHGGIVVSFPDNSCLILRDADNSVVVQNDIERSDLADAFPVCTIY